MTRRKDYISYDFDVQSLRSASPLRGSLEMVRARLFVVLAVFCAIFSVIIFRLFDVCVLSSKDGSHFARGLKGSHLVSRTNIVDRRGEILATSLKTQSLYANSKVVLDPKEAAEKLLTVFPELNKKSLEAKLKSGKGFVWLVRHITPAKQADVMRLGIPGIYFQADERRVYPHGPLLSHVIGYVDIDNQGLAGVEKKMDHLLRSQKEPVELSMDLRLQHVLRDELSKSIEKFQAQGAAGVILDVKTGEVMAMASLPDFDPNRVADTKDPNAFFNKNTLGVYEMGSTFKIFNAAMVLEKGTSHISKQYDVSQPLRIGRFRIKDYHPYHGSRNTGQIFVTSSNIGAAKLAMEAGAQNQIDFFKTLGLFEEAKLEIPENGKPIIPKKWSDATVITASYGYGISVSIMQSISAVAGIANHGVMHQPTLLKASLESPKEGRRVVSEETSDIMRKLFYMVVTEGTGKKAAVNGYWVGGKSGTANIISGRSYKEGSNNTSFVGVFPVSDPKFLVFVMINQPQGIKETYGFNASGWNAAPTAGKIIRRIAPLMNVSPVAEDSASPHNDMVLLEAKCGGH